MSSFDLEESFEKARSRFKGRPRARRADRGRFRVEPGVLRCVARALDGQDKPSTRDLMKDVTKRCRKRGLQAPSRATVYKLMSRLPARTYRVGDLPAVVQKSLYNLRPESEVPGHQLAFCCFNYGQLRGRPSLAVPLPGRQDAWVHHEEPRTARGRAPCEGYPGCKSVTHWR
jgi:hypothetical protein